MVHGKFPIFENFHCFKLKKSFSLLLRYALYDIYMMPPRMLLAQGRSKNQEFKCFVEQVVKRDDSRRQNTYEPIKTLLKFVAIIKDAIVPQSLVQNGVNYN